MAIKFINLEAAQKDAVSNLKIKDKGPADPATLAELKTRLTAAKGKLPPIYRTAVYEPFVATINGLSEADFKKIRHNENLGFTMIDIAHAILQDAEHYQPDATDAFEEVVSDLYDGFLSAEDRRNIKLPDHELIPPLVKWGNPADGPYTLPNDATAAFNLQCAIVNLPPSHAKGGLVGWGCLGHETAGHDIVHADVGLLDEMSQAVKKAIKGDKKIKSTSLRNTLAIYWSDRMDETSADIMGILNMGPAAAAVIIPYFRALIGSNLRSEGPSDDEHPADILRVMLGASCIRLLSFSKRKDWATAVLDEGLKDMETIILNDTTKVDKTSAQRSADVVALTLMQTPFAALNHHALQEIQDWADDDEKIVAGLRNALNGKTAPTSQIMNGAYAAHVVAAAVYEALLVKQEITPLFDKMIQLLKQMHDGNPSWGPLFVVHPGDLKRDFIIKRGQ